jgi:hypothetical protein
MDANDGFFSADGADKRGWGTPILTQRRQGAKKILWLRNLALERLKTENKLDASKANIGPHRPRFNARCTR